MTPIFYSGACPRWTQPIRDDWSLEMWGLQNKKISQYL